MSEPDPPVEVGDVPNTSEYGLTVDDRNDVFVILYDFISELRGDAKRKSAAAVTMEELRNRSVYELIGETVSDITYDTDDTLPWVKTANTTAEEPDWAAVLAAKTPFAEVSVDFYGGKVHDVAVTTKALLEGIDFILANEDDFDDLTLVEAGLLAAEDEGE